jgi:hypothetical protein
MQSLVKVCTRLLATLVVSSVGGASLVQVPPGGGGGAPHYEISYSTTNGMATSTGPYGSFPNYYTATTTSIGGSAITGGPGQSPDTFLAGPGSADCAGEVKAHFVWNNAGNPAANPPPAVVIVRESCTASWSGDSGSCSNGLGNPETGTTYAKSSTGDRLSIVTTNTDDFYVSCSPTASVTQLDPPPSGYPAGSCGVTYSATGYVPKLTFDGT